MQYDRRMLQEMPLVTIERNGDPDPNAMQEEQTWYEIENAYLTKKPLYGVLSGVERTKQGNIVILYYKDHRVVIPVEEMDLVLPKRPEDDEKTIAVRQHKLLNFMIGCELDFIVLGLDSNDRSVVGSRRLAMLYNRKKYYFPRDNNEPMIRKGVIVQARVLAVAEKVARLEAFGVETMIVARDISWEWIGDARELLHVGDRVLAVVSYVKLYPETMKVKIDLNMRILTRNDALEKLDRCMVQGRYSGRITDIYKGNLYVHLDIGVNAVAHKCTDPKFPGKNDKVTFVVNRIDREKAIAIGIVSRIIRQDL